MQSEHADDGRRAFAADDRARVIDVEHELLQSTQRHRLVVIVDGVHLIFNAGASIEQHPLAGLLRATQRRRRDALRNLARALDVECVADAAKQMHRRLSRRAHRRARARPLPTRRLAGAR